MFFADLCVSCGLCCRGPFFRYALLTEDEVARLAELGVPTARRRNGQPAIRLGCQALRGTACSIYERRPQACRAYFCQLAFRVRDGLVTWEQAQEVIARTQAVLAQIEAELPPPQPDDPPSSIERAYQYGLVSGPALLREAEALFREHYLGPGQP